MGEGASAGRRALVTGGGGFLGGAIVDLLLARGWEVRSLSRGQYPALVAKGVQCTAADLADETAVARAVEGCDTVFHVAAKAGVWGPRDDYVAANERGSAVLLRACQDAGVRRLIYTSSPSVVQTDGDCEGGDETLPYPTRFRTAYQATKAAAERLILSANGSSLATVALRPRLIWGPGDPHLVPRLVSRARAGRLRIVGDGDNRVDMTYIDDAARAHIDALDRLVEAEQAGVTALCSGRAYFISGGQPRPFRVALNDLLQAHGVPPIDRHVPAWLAFAVGGACELVWSVCRLSGEPPMTRFLARQLATANWYDLSAARRDLGYEPKVSWDEGIERLRATRTLADAEDQCA